MASSMTLHSYWRSSAAYRVRLALQFKQLAYDMVYVNLRQNAQSSQDYLARNPEGLVPVLEVDGLQLSQSIAIMEYLEQTHPTPALLPADAAGRARVRALAQFIACEIHPINNLRILRYLVGPLGVSEQAKDTWYAHWVRDGLERFEQRLSESGTGLFCHGDTPTMADCVLMPQVFNARIMKVPLDGLVKLQAIEARLLALDPVRRAYPFSQEDAVGEPGPLALPTL
jgi:maleylacetoacetate isomerase/maleylpyruvate isomerase